MTDKLKDLPQEIIDAFFTKTPEGASHEKMPKKAIFIIASLFTLSLVLLIIIIILYIIPYKQKTAVSKGAVSSENSRYAGHIVKTGMVNRLDIERVYFDGDAVNKSSFLENSIELTNSGSYGRAALIIKFREETDLDGKNIMVLARAKYGIKKVNLILKDFQNRFYERPAMEFSPNWGLKQVHLNKANGVDLKRITEMRLEFGRYTAGNEENSTIYLKDITVRGGV